MTVMVIRHAGVVCARSAPNLPAALTSGVGIRRHLYLVPNSLVVTRGCPHHCDFCYKDAFFEGGKGFYVQAVDDALPRSSGCRDAICTSWTTTC
jgi:hypothetical protein